MYHDELLQVAQMVWESMLQLELVPVEQERQPSAEDLSAHIDISGAWEGLVVASCSEPLARRLAGVLLQMEPDRVLPGHVRDALAEIANMLGGSIKALFPGPCKLSLPSVEAVSEASPRAPSELLDKVCFDCQGDTFSVELRRSSLAAAGHVTGLRTPSV